MRCTYQLARELSRHRTRARVLAMSKNRDLTAAKSGRSLMCSNQKVGGAYFKKGRGLFYSPNADWLNLKKGRSLNKSGRSLNRFRNNPFRRTCSNQKRGGA